MRLHTEAFPYPILSDKSDNTTDYKSSTFTSNLSMIETIAENGEIVITCSFETTNEEIKKHIGNKKASFAIEVSCTDTIFKEIYNCNEQDEISINGNNCYGKVEFTPIIVIKENIKKFQSRDLNDEFGDSNFDLFPGDIIATNAPVVKTITFDAPKLGDIIVPRTKKELGEYEYEIEVTPSLIFLNMGTKMSKLHNLLYQGKDKKILGISLYKDVIYQAICKIIESKETDDPPKWATLLEKTVSTHGEIPTEYDFNSINKLSQKMFPEGAEDLYKQEIQGEY